MFLSLSLSLSPPLSLSLSLSLSVSLSTSLSISEERIDRMNQWIQHTSMSLLCSQFFCLSFSWAINIAAVYEGSDRIQLFPGTWKYTHDLPWTYFVVVAVIVVATTIVLIFFNQCFLFADIVIDNKYCSGQTSPIFLHLTNANRTKQI